MNWIRIKSKYNAKPTVYDSISFSSMAEKEFYQLLKADPKTLHIDCHVPVSLPGGIRFNIDFIVYKKIEGEEVGGQIDAIEVKGFSTMDFQNKRKLFDSVHPLKPLQVYRKVGGRWESI